MRAVRNDALLARGSKGISQLPLEPLANSDIPLVVIIDLLLLKKTSLKSEIRSCMAFISSQPQ